jgi:hypothetical protein
MSTIKHLLSVVTAGVCNLCGRGGQPPGRISCLYCEKST